jgi:hypothetical protein
VPTQVSESPSHTQPPEDLPYRVDLWRGDSGTVERVLARAASVQLAHAIFRAAREEHPERRVTLSHGQHVVADTQAR